MTPKLLTPRRFEDARGWFSETWSKRGLAAAGIETEFVQDNHSLSRTRGTLRGLHFQTPPHAQAKLVRCLSGRIFDVAVDLRRDSPSYGKWLGVELSAEIGNQLFVPHGYGHAFLTLTDDAQVAYKVDDYYAQECDAGVIWSDPNLAIVWPDLATGPILSDKDSALPLFSELAIDFPYDGIPLTPLAEQDV